MQKKSLLAMLLALTLLLSGCTLIQKDPEVDAATEILRLGDQVVTKGEIQKDVNYQLQYMSYLYSMYGYNYDPTSAENIAEVRETVIGNYKEELVKTEKIGEMKLDQLTEEEETKAKENAEASYQDNLDYIISDNADLADLSDEEKTAKAKEQLESTGYTMETALEDAREEVLADKLRAEIIKDVTVGEDEIQAEYDSKVASAKETYENNAGAWASAANNGTSPLYYTPAGVRFVKQILIKFTDDGQAKIDAANEKVTAAQTKVTDAQKKADDADTAAADAQAILDNEESSAEDRTTAEADLTAAQAEQETAKSELEAAQTELTAAQAELQTVTDAAFAEIDADTDAVLAQLAEGADWETLMAEKNQDPGMQSGVTAERGYAVSADMTSFDAAFVEAAMALENIGDVSGKVRGNSYGYYIIRYVSDAVEGAIAMDEVKEAISEELLDKKQDTTYDEQIKAWVDEAEARFKVNMKALDD